MVSIPKWLPPVAVGTTIAAWDLNLMPTVVNEAVKSVIGVVPSPRVTSFVITPTVHAYTMNLAFFCGTVFLIFLISENVFNRVSTKC